MLSDMAFAQPDVFFTPRQKKLRDEYLAFLSLAWSESRFAHEYKGWALEMEQEGKLDAYRRYRTESDRLWRSAKRHLDLARRCKDALYA